MEVRAKVKHIRISPRKMRLVVDLVRGMPTKQALNQLKFLHKKATVPVEKIIKSAIANAEHNYELKSENLYIKEIRVDEGKTLHRWMPRAYGRATPIRKRTSHVVVALAELVDSGKVTPKKQDIEAPVNIGQMTGQKEDKIAGKKDRETKASVKASSQEGKRKEAKKQKVI